MHNKATEFFRLCNKRYLHDPVLFAEEVLKIKLTEKQQIPALRALAENPKHMVAVKSGHGTGKSFVASVAIVWFMCTRPMCNIIVTAPSSNQLYNTMMKEIRKRCNESIIGDLELFRFTKNQMKINNDSYANIWFLSAVSVANPENISGAHAEDIFVVIDEGAGVDREIFVRVEGMLTTKNVYVLTLGNPSFTSGYFYDVFNNEKFSSKYDLFTFNSEDSPNVEKIWIEYMREKYGEDSNIYKVRVLGEFAPMDEEVIIRREDVACAIGRKLIKNNETVTFIGVDVASGKGMDSSVISIRRGLEEIERYKANIKLRELQNTIKRVISKYRCCSSKIVVNVDTTGLGIQLGQDLEDFYYDDYERVSINCINFAFKAINSQKYANAFTEMFFILSEKIEIVSLLNQDESTAEEDLGSRRFTYDNRGRYIAERKKEFIKRFGRSPDEGDAILLAFYDVEEARVLEENYVDREDW